MTDFAHTCTLEHARLFATWIAERGGVAVWGCLNLATPDRSWSTPADGTKPHWSATDSPIAVYTDPDQIGVIQYKEVDRFHVAVRKGAQGLSLKLTDASSNKLLKRMAKHDDEAIYVFDYLNQEAVVMVPDYTTSLTEWIATNTLD